MESKTCSYEIELPDEEVRRQRELKKARDDYGKDNS